ncbi:MAG: hypothetical protein HWD58_20290 [Bacteroidota bacterium]|nr:MAG: hypothetical protein HWD58_20265 [Bacteroidota bacterium]QLH47738.1 MAG: hypothetical protein HWD58_20290 [Bacteroidota bacterium]
MTDTQSLAIEILKLVPDNSMCFINAPSIHETSEVLKLFQPSKHYDWQLKLNEGNRNKLIENILKENIESEFHMLTIENNEHPLFIAYDGMCGVLVKKVQMSQNGFVESSRKH